jgi:ABC-type dipeptide/oligopeptide/nickel transport system permease component
MTVLRMAATRLLSAAPQLFGVVLVSFFLLKLIPGDPAPMMLGPLATTEAVEKLRAEMGLDQPLPIQFGRYVERLAHGDLGRSWQTTNPVSKDLRERLPATLELVVLGLALAIAIGLPLGLAAGRSPFGRAASAADLYSFGAGAMPDFWIALMLIYLFYATLGWAPAPLGRLDIAMLPPERFTGSFLVDALLAGDIETARAAASQLVLPVLTLGLVTAIPILKITRSAVEQLNASDFVRFAAAKGLPAWRISRHVLRAALPQIVPALGPLASALIGGTVLIEVVFAWGAAGQYAVSAVLNADINAALGFVLAAAALSLVIHLLVDLLSLGIDPRIRTA